MVRLICAFIKQPRRFDLSVLLQHSATIVRAGTDEAVAQRVADAICIQRSTAEGLPDRTRAFASFIAAVKGKEYQGFHPAKLVFQAVRTHDGTRFSALGPHDRSRRS